MFGVGGGGWGRARGMWGGREGRNHDGITQDQVGGWWWGRPTQGHLWGGMRDSVGHHSVGWASFGGRVFGLSTYPDRTGPPRGPAGETPSHAAPHLEHIRYGFGSHGRGMCTARPQPTGGSLQVGHTRACRAVPLVRRAAGGCCPQGAPVRLSNRTPNDPLGP